MADFPTPAGATRTVTILLTSESILTPAPDPKAPYSFTDPLRIQTISRLAVDQNLLTAVPDPKAPYLFTGPTMSGHPYPGSEAGGGGEPPPTVVFDSGQIWPRGQGKAT